MEKLNDLLAQLKSATSWRDKEAIKLEILKNVSAVEELPYSDSWPACAERDALYTEYLSRCEAAPLLTALPVRFQHCDNSWDGARARIVKDYVRAVVATLIPDAVAQYDSVDGLADGEIYNAVRFAIESMTGLKVFRPKKDCEWVTDAKPTRAEYAALLNVREEIAKIKWCPEIKCTATLEVCSRDNDCGETDTHRLITVYIFAADDATWEINLAPD